MNNSTSQVHLRAPLSRSASANEIAGRHGFVIDPDEQELLELIRKSEIGPLSATAAINKAFSARVAAAESSDDEDEPLAPPTAPEEPGRALALTVIRWAREDHRRAGKALAYGNEVAAAFKATLPENHWNPPEFQTFGRWVDTLCDTLCDAEERLCAATLILFGRLGRMSDAWDLAPGWSPVCLELDGELLVVAPRDEQSYQSALPVIANGDQDSCQFGL